jgi:riboflavin biosynthesis pyrimidine reductase
MHVKGPGSPFELLFTDDPIKTAELPDPFRAIYGDWHIPEYPDRAYLYTNFATARDGRVSYNFPGKSTGGDVTNFNPHDRWLMGLLRARADCIVMGDSTLATEREHIWTAEFIWPEDADAFTALRHHEKLDPRPLVVFLSLSGQIDESVNALCDSDAHIIIATTVEGAKHANALRCKAALEVISFDGPSVDLTQLMRYLYTQHGKRRILCEGGPRVMGGMLAAGLVDEEFVTLCPNVLGRSEQHFRPSYVEGVAFMPGQSPYSKPYSLRRAGDFLYMQTRCSYPGRQEQP